jgi:hypothetical protein
LFRKNSRHLCIRKCQKDNVAALGHLARLEDRQLMGAGEAATFAAAAQSNDNIESAIAEI